MRGMRNVRSAQFAGVKVRVGEIGQYLYVSGLTDVNRDEWWVRLEAGSDGSYVARLGRGQVVRSRLEFTSDQVTR